MRRGTTLPDRLFTTDSGRPARVLQLDTNGNRLDALGRYRGEWLITSNQNTK